MKGEKLMFCQQCGTKNEDYSKFCIKCGAKLPLPSDMTYAGSGNVAGRESGSPAAVYEIKTTQESIDSKDYFGDTGAVSKKKDGIKKLIMGVVLAAAVVALVFGIVNIFKKDSSPKSVSRDWSKLPIMYIKSSDLMLKRNGNKEPYVVTSGSSYYYGSIAFTEDGKTMFFADDPSSGEFRLYYRKVDEETPKGKNADSIGIKIASGVSSFKIQKDGKFVVYNKSGKLYYTDLDKEERLIARNVGDFDISGDEKKVVFRNTEGDLYVCGLGKKDEPERIDTEVTQVVSSLDEYEIMYYIKDSSLYRKEYGKERERLARDVLSGRMIDEQVYVVKKDEFDQTPGYTLYKIENGEEIKITDCMEERTLYATNYIRGDRIIYQSAAAFLTIPEDSDYPEYDDGIRELYIISQNNSPFKAMEIDINETGYYSLSLDGKYFYIIEDLDYENNAGVLYRYTVGTDSLKDKTKICDEASYVYPHNEDVVTMLYSDGETIMGFYSGGKYYELSDAASENYQYFKGALYYLEDYSNNYDSGTLMKFKNGKSEKIDTDVHDFFVRDEADIVYIKDYSTRRNYGDLYQKKGSSEPARIDTDVSSIIRVYYYY